MEKFENHKIEKCKDSFYACDICSFRTSDKRKLTYHKKDQHSTNQFKCDDCDFNSGFENKIKIHKERSHTYIECIVCKFTTSKQRTFDLHIKTKHGGSKFGHSANSEKCSVCKIVPKTKKAFQRHQFMKHKEGDFEDPVTIGHQLFSQRSEKNFAHQLFINITTI